MTFRLRRPRRMCGAALVVLLTFVAGADPYRAEAQEAPAGSLRGRVVDAREGAPVAGANVMLIRPAEGSSAGELGDEVPPGRVHSERATDPQGRYAFADLPPGRYVLRVERLGYRPVIVEVRLGPSPGSQVSVALEVEPIRLSALEVTAPGGAEVVTADGTRVELGRMSAIRLRQRRFMSSDSRVLTPTDVQESVTLGELDILRALQRLPGVTTRDDYSAELWTRGAEWSQTRVYMDGLPLFNPLHAGGVLSGMSTRGLAAAHFHPGVRPVDYAEGGAAVLDLASRSGLGTDQVDGGAELGLASGQVWARGPVGPRAGWAASARRSWVDLATEALSRDPDERLPYDFQDAQLRLDTELGNGARLEVSGLWQRDRVRGEIPDLLHGTEGEWGNASLGIALSGTLGRFRARQLVGATGYFVRIRTFASALDWFSAPSGEPVDHHLRYATLSGQLEPLAEDPSWTVGYDLTHQSTAYVGPEPWPYSSAPPDLPEVDRDAALTRIGLWARRRLRLTDEIEVEGGVRASAGGGLKTGMLTLAPSGSVRYQVTPSLTLSGGMGRYVQLTQSPAAIGPRIETVLQTGRLWVLAGSDAPAVETTTATLGGEAWLGGSWLASATGYVRRTEGLLVPDPTPGLLVQRRPLVEGTVQARGVDLSLRQVEGRVTGSLAYSLADADAGALGIDFPAPADRTHALDLTLLARVTGGFGVSAAYTHVSGAPYTRILPCSAEGCQGLELDAPFRRRAPAYASLDLSLEYQHRLESWSWGFYVQARNLLNHDNDITYRSSSVFCEPGFGSPPCRNGSSSATRDRFVDGIPTIPVLGLRVTF